LARRKPRSARFSDEEIEAMERWAEEDQRSVAWLIWSAMRRALIDGGRLTERAKPRSPTRRQPKAKP
jgi:hypothetical protein